MTYNIHQVIDLHIGRRIHERRKSLKFLIEQLSAYSYISISDLYDIEVGMGRVSAGQVFNLSAVLNIPISYFFEESKFCTNKELDRLLSAYINIKTDDLRHKFLKLLEAMK